VSDSGTASSIADVRFELCVEPVDPPVPKVKRMWLSHGAQSNKSPKPTFKDSSWPARFEGLSDVGQVESANWL